MRYTQVANIMDKVMKIKDLEVQLRDECITKGLEKINGFTIMFNEEDGRTIRYVQGMLLELTGGMKEFYDKNSSYFNSKYHDIHWPYTGFVQGNILGWMPISSKKIVEWLEEYDYNLEDFIKEFSSKTI